MNILLVNVYKKLYRLLKKLALKSRISFPTYLYLVKRLICNILVIMNSNIEKGHIQNQYQLQQENKETKKFVQDMFKIDYINTSKIFYQLPQNSPEVKVNNYLCYKQGDTLYKVTEILYEDKLIRIQDKFEVSLDTSYLSSGLSVVSAQNQKKNKNRSRSIQKVRIFNKNSIKNTKAQRKDKKNIVKNVVKIFIAWLERKQKANLCPYSNSLEQVRNFLHSQNFNNRLIQKIISSQVVSKTFLQFVQDSAQQQIKYSRIQDKQSHYQALQIYKSLLNKQNFGIRLSNSHNSLSSQPFSEDSSYQMLQNKQTQKNNSLGTGPEPCKNESCIQALIKEKRSQDKVNKLIVFNNGCVI